jgi:hypothetical protein
VLGADDLGWLVERLRRRLESGGALTGTVTLADPTAEQRRAVGHLTGRRPGRGQSVTVSLTDLEQELRDAEVAPDLRTAVEVLVGPLADLPGRRLPSSIVATPWCGRWAALPRPEPVGTTRGWPG